MKHETSCGSVVFTRKGKDWAVLLTKNKRGGHWSFPKGHVEKGENFLQTAKREVLEETGLSVTPLDGFCDSIEYCCDRDTVKTVWYYVSVVPADAPLVPQPEEVSAIRWVAYDNAFSHITYAADGELLRAAYTFLTEHEDTPCS